VDKLDTEGQQYLQHVRTSSQRMGELINDLLELSRLTRSQLRHKVVDLSALAEKVIETLYQGDPRQETEIIITPGMQAYADERMLRIVLENLIGNAWKFTSKHHQTRIEVGVMPYEGEQVYFVRDDGAGFDIQYADKLFVPFQRMHSADSFEGTGIGLATVLRIIHRHGGRVWVESAVEHGATFYFTLPVQDIRK
jgi:light-regulated signal transduction histidine kinase (bacteriophytochrome)